MPVKIPRANQPITVIPESGLPPKDISKIQKIMDALEAADTDKNGCYDKDEVKHALKDLGAFFPGWRADRAFGKVDLNNDGQISGEEISSLLDYLRFWGFGK